MRSCARAPDLPAQDAPADSEMSSVISLGELLRGMPPLPQLDVSFAAHDAEGLRKHAAAAEAAGTGSAPGTASPYGRARRTSSSLPGALRGARSRGVTHAAPAPPSSLHQTQRSTN